MFGWQTKAQKLLSRRIAHEVLSALECSPNSKPDDCGFAHAFKRIDATPRKITKKERDWADAEAVNSAKRLPADSWWPKLLRQVVDNYEGKYKAQPLPTEIHSLRFGDLAIVTNPFELFVDYAFQIMGRSPALQTSVAQLANGTGIYLPTARGAQNGSYGAMPAVAPIGPEGGQEVVETSIELITKLFAK